MVLTGISGTSQYGAVISMSHISDDSTPVRKDVTAVINTLEVMIVLEVIVPCRWPLVALAYASPETTWLRLESAYIFHHKYPIPEYSMIFGNHGGHSSREAPKPENNAVTFTALLFIVHNDKGFPLLWLINCYHWCNLILCRMIAYGWEFIESGFPRSKSTRTTRTPVLWDTPAAPWLPILVIHIRSWVKTRQSQSYKLKKTAKNANFEILP